MGKILKTTKFALLENLAQEISAGVERYYVFASHPGSWPDDNNPPSTFESVSDSIFDTQQQMLFGKRLKPTDGRFLAKRNDWTPNEKYAQYEDTDVNLFDKKFYVITDENKVYKCLNNASNANSTSKPSLTQNTAFTTSDGYMWKYMYTATPTDMNRFSSVDFIPVLPDSDVVASAKAGIDVIQVESGGVGYLTWHKGTIQSQTNTSLFQIENSASPDDNFYNNSSFYLDSGPASGALRKVTGYVSNSTGNWVTVDSAIAGIVPSLTKYSITPRIDIKGDGTGATALATLSSANSISGITILSTGNGYSRATATVLANTSYGSGASLTVRVAPPGGHGSNPYYELGVDAFGVSVQFANNESLTIPTETNFRRYGLLKNPQFPTNPSPYDSNTFNQVMKFELSPPTVYLEDAVIFGDTSGARGVVVYSNTSVLYMVGDRTFANSEGITSESGTHATISSVITYGDINPSTNKILYINNTTPIERANTESETVKLIIQL